MPCIDPFVPRAGAAFVVLAALGACHTSPPQPARAAGATESTTHAAVAPTGPYRRPAHTIEEYRLQAAARLVAANPRITYTTPSPDPLLAIPILEIEVNADGSVRHITVKRVPTQAADTVQIAIDAVNRAAPFGDATQMPRPWKFTEVFLFDDDRRFKPRILD